MDISCPSCWVVGEEKVQEISATVGFRPEQNAEVLSREGIQVPQVLKTQAPVLETPEDSISDPTDPPSNDLELVLDISEHPETPPSPPPPPPPPPPKKKKKKRRKVKRKIRGPCFDGDGIQKNLWRFQCHSKPQKQRSVHFRDEVLDGDASFDNWLSSEQVQAISIGTVLSHTVVDDGYKN